MSTFWLTKKEARALAEIEKDDMSDTVSLVARVGYNPRIFFVGRDCSGLDFRGSNIKGIDFRDSILDRAYFYSDQLTLAKETNPLSIEDPNISVRELAISDEFSRIDVPNVSENIPESQTTVAEVESTVEQQGEMYESSTEIRFGFDNNVLQDLCSRLGYHFADLSILKEALTHKSRVHDSRPSNEVLAFMGNKLLQMVMCDGLIVSDRRQPMMQLHLRLTSLIRSETSVEAAEVIGLRKFMMVKQEEIKANSRGMAKAVGDAMQAVLGAVYIDGGYDAARQLVLRFWALHLAKVDQVARDPKTTLQEREASRGLGRPVYLEISREGPAHLMVFTVEVRLSDGQTARGVGSSKRAAEFAAATEVLARD